MITSLSGAALSTALDALLLEQRRAYFTGGFLATDSATSIASALLFLTISFIIDLALIGTVAMVARELLHRIGVSGRTVVPATLLIALSPFVAVNVIEYRLLAYFGDAFDAGLMFDLAGNDPAEFIAVAWPQLLGALLIVAGLASVGVMLVWRRRRTRPLPPPMRLLSMASAALTLLVIGAGVTLAARAGDDVLDNGVRRKPSGRFFSLVVNTLSDFDGDGTGLLGRPADPDLFDAAVRPYAVDIPGDGVDQDGIGGDLIAGLPVYSERSYDSAGWRARPDLVLVVLESFRADAIGASVDGHPVTPVLDRLASQGVWVKRAYSHNGYTVQSRRHIFSGSTADLAVTTLIDDFNAQGYETAYFSGQDESFGGAGQSVGFDRANRSYDAREDRDRRYSTFSTAGSLAVSHKVVNERVNAFLRARSPQPLFLYVNFHDTHFPYQHRDILPIVSSIRLTQGDIVPDRSVAVRDMYLNTAANVDRAIGELLANVRLALGHEPAVIVLSDHGESLFEEGFLGHGYALNDAQTRIPLIVSGLPMRVQEPFGQSDLRGLIHDALTGDAPLTGLPLRVENSSKRVFQYLGTLDAARQIAFVSRSGRVAYDIRDRRVRIDDGPWTAEREVAPGQRHTVMELVYTWERMRLARSQVSHNR